MLSPVKRSSKKDFGTKEEVFDGKAVRTKHGLLKRGLAKLDDKVVKKYGSVKEVFDGEAMKTVGGLKKQDLMKNKRGKIVSIKRHNHGVKMIQKNSEEMGQAFTKKSLCGGIAKLSPVKTKAEKPKMAKTLSPVKRTKVETA